MRFTDFSDFCRLCLMPLDGPHLDCAIDDNDELKDTIKMVYNIDVSANLSTICVFIGHNSRCGIISNAEIGLIIVKPPTICNMYFI